MTTAPRGFTLIELLMTLAIVAILASAAFPLSEISARRMKERELREGLWQLRAAIDDYKKAVDDGKIVRAAGDSGYPPNLNALVEGVANAKDPAGRKLYFLRRIPRDPFTEDPALPAHRSWGQRSYDSPPDEPREGRDVFDVYSLSAKIGLNGIAYRAW
jgi:general secretion pathway protein G